MFRLSLCIIFTLISFAIIAQQQLITHWVPSKINEKLIGNDISDYSMLGTTNAQDIFQVSYVEANSPKAHLLGVITKKESFNQCLNEKINSEEIQILETNQIDINGISIQLKLLKNSAGEKYYATCLSLAYNIPPTFDIYTAWEWIGQHPIHNILYYEMKSTDQEILIELVSKIFDKLEKEASINWTPIQITTSVTDEPELSNLELIIYPNPTSNFIKFQSLNPKSMQVIIYNLQGKQMIKKVSHDTRQGIEINQLSQGNYFITLQDESQKITKELVVIR